MQGIVPFLQRKKKKRRFNKKPHNDGKMDVNISAWLIISDVTLGKPQLSEWFICQAVEGFTPIMGYLANAAMGSGGRLRAGSKRRRVLMFSGDFICFWCLRWNFHFKQRKNKRDKEAVGCFCLFCFSLHVFFFSAKLWNWMFGPQGWSCGWGFPGFSVISLVLYFFGVQKPCRDIMREFTQRDLAKGWSKIWFCRTQQALWVGDAKRPRPMAPFPGGHRTLCMVVICYLFALVFENYLICVKALVCFSVMSTHRITFFSLAL